MNFFQYLRILLLPLSLIYWIVLLIRNYIYSSHFFRKLFNLQVLKSQIPVVCIGNIRVGGTGKTQILITIAHSLIERNQKVAILSRGYKRKSKGFFEVTSFDYEKFGDEPVLLKMNLNSAKVFVSENRVYGIQEIFRIGNFDFILMDDGLQNLTVQKDYSIVLIDKNYFSKNPIERLLLPAGNLREGRKKIFSYDKIIYNQKFSHEIKKFNDFKNLHLAKYVLKNFQSLDEKIVEIEELKKHNVGAFCGIAQPNSFKELLSKNSIFPQFFKVFSDHHSYQIQDLKLLLKFVEKFGCKYLITTEKDIVRVTKFKNEFERAEVFLIYAKITAEISNEENLIQDILCLKKK
ncbi:MAG: tetraacyldisaccharide 4'-kinase [Ignavibacteria bacterium]|nr:tetraacyldisaccharide 4'-kinase [Ignavibacteria bacterium]